MKPAVESNQHQGSFLGQVYIPGKGGYYTVSMGHGYPGHQEIELALIKLYRATGKKQYLDMAKYFIDRRGVAVVRRGTRYLFRGRDTNLPEIN